MKDINIRAKTIKHLEENITEKLYDFVFFSDFLDMTKNTCTKNKQTKKAGFIKILYVKRHYQ